MHLSRRVQGNLLAVVIAFFLSIALYAGVTQYTNLATDIRGVTGADNSITTDLLVQIDESALSLYAQKNIPDVDALSVLFLYDNESVRWADGTVVSAYDTAIAPGDGGEVSVLLTIGGSSFEKGEEILRLNVTGSPYDIVVADVVVTFTDGASDPLSITLP